MTQKKYKTGHDLMGKGDPQGNSTRDWNLTILQNGICPNQNPPSRRRMKFSLRYKRITWSQSEDQSLC